MTTLHGISVAITSANATTGQLIIPELKKLGAQVTALVRKPVEIADASQTITEWMTNPAALEALGQADMVIHLSGELVAKNYQGYHAAHVATTELVLKGARQNSRIISFSYPGADPTAKNFFLRSMGVREKLLADKNAVVFRASAMINTPEKPGPFELIYLAKEGKPIQMIGNGSQRIRPVYRGDVVAFTIAALERGKPGIYNLGGPDDLSQDEFVKMLNGGKPVKLSHMPGWLMRPLSRFIPDLPPTLVDLSLQDANPESSATEREFGVKLTSLKPFWLKNQVVTMS